MLSRAVTVKQLNLYVKSLLEGDSRLADICVTGELSNFKNHYSSGHWYFTLKDKDAAIRCVMFRFSASRVSFVPEDGMSVVLRGRASVYEKDGQYQFYAEEMTSAGEGDLAAAFEKLKQKLLAEGLFDQETKRPIPKFPKKIAVITSNTGAAVRDILTILERRYPLCEIIMCPVQVQGELAAADMIQTLDRVYSLDGIDTVIIGRGGGSAEDLSCFNSEALARKIYESPFPVISAVGHETDFTICDFVADLRAPTPSAAAELAAPDISELCSTVLSQQKRMSSALILRLRLCESKIETAKQRISKKRMLDFADKKALELDRIATNLKDGAEDKLSKAEQRFSNAVMQIDMLSPLKTLARGFAAVQKDGMTVKSSEQLSVGDSIRLSLADGSAECTVDRKD